MRHQRLLRFVGQSNYDDFHPLAHFLNFPYQGNVVTCCHMMTCITIFLNNLKIMFYLIYVFDLCNFDKRDTKICFCTLLRQELFITILLYKRQNKEPL